MAFPEFFKKRRDRLSSPTDDALIGSTDQAGPAGVSPIKVGTRKDLGIEVTTGRWDPSCDLVSLLEGLHRLKEEGAIASDDLVEQKRRILGVPEPFDDDTEILWIDDLWKHGKWLAGRAGASLSRTDDPVWQVERLQRLREHGTVTDQEFSYLERELLHPGQAGLRRRLKDLDGLRGRPPRT